jgi:hypothetical protein
MTSHPTQPGATQTPPWPLAWRAVHARTAAPGVSRRHALLAVPALVAARPARAATWALVTEEEAAESARIGLPPLSRSLGQGAAPRIEVVAPVETAALRAPLTIRLTFSAAPGGRIDPDSFRALYGALRLDVTDRIRRHARVDAAGLLAESVAMPAGRHRILLFIADNQGRRGERDFRLLVT